MLNYFKLNLAKAAQYRVSFVMNILMMMANDAFFIIQWVIVFSLVPDIGGYQFNDIMLFWAMAAGSFGFAHVFFHGAFSISDKIYSGKLDVFLTQPKHVLVNVACSSTSVSAMGDLLYAFVALFIIQAPWSTFLFMVPFLVCSGLIYVSVYVIYDSLSFIVKRGDAIASSVESSMLKLVSYPPTIFNTVVKGIMFSLVPAGLIAFIPVQIIKSFHLGYFALYIAFTILMILIAFAVFAAGLKRYNSGNLLSSRL